MCKCAGDEMKLRCFISPGINKVAHYHIFVWNLFDSHFCELAFGVLYASVLKLITIDKTESYI